MSWSSLAGEKCTLFFGGGMFKFSCKTSEMMILGDSWNQNV